MVKISDEMIEAYSAGLNSSIAEQLEASNGVTGRAVVRAGLEAVAPLIAAQVLREHHAGGSHCHPCHSPSCAWMDTPGTDLLYP